MPEPARIVVDPDELERVTSEVVREVPAHLVASEVRKRMAAASVRKVKPSVQARIDQAASRFR